MSPALPNLILLHSKLVKKTLCCEWRIEEICACEQEGIWTAYEFHKEHASERDQLPDRRDELDKSATLMEELVEVLDQRKEEAIERTFKQVASNFEEVFEKLIRAGRGWALPVKTGSGRSGRFLAVSGWVGFFRVKAGNFRSKLFTVTSCANCLANVVWLVQYFNIINFVDRFPSHL